jgi:hypothetical protein
MCAFFRKASRSLLLVGRLGDETDHPLRGLWIVLSQRHTAHDGQYNLTAADVEHDHTTPLRDVAKLGVMRFAAAKEEGRG